MLPKIDATPVEAVYVALRASPYVGQVRKRTWRPPIISDIQPNDPLWNGRFRAYWDLQARTYGIKFGAYTWRAWEDENGPLVTTWAIVEAIMPGERVNTRQ